MSSLWSLFNGACRSWTLSCCSAPLHETRLCLHTRSTSITIVIKFHEGINSIPLTIVVAFGIEATRKEFLLRLTASCVPMQNPSLEVPRMVLPSAEAAAEGQAGSQSQAALAILQAVPAGAPAPSQSNPSAHLGAAPQASHPHNAAADPLLARQDFRTDSPMLASSTPQEGASVAAPSQAPMDPRTKKRPLPKAIPRAKPVSSSGRNAQAGGQQAETPHASHSQLAALQLQPSGLAMSNTSSERPSGADSSKRQKLDRPETGSVSRVTVPVDADEDSGGEVDISSPLKPAKIPLRDQSWQQNPPKKQLKEPRLSKPQLNEHAEAKVNDLWATAWDDVMDSDSPAGDSGSNPPTNGQQKRSSEAANNAGGKHRTGEGQPSTIANLAAAAQSSTGPWGAMEDLGRGLAGLAHSSQSGPNAPAMSQISGGFVDQDLDPAHLPDLSLLANIQALVQLQSSQQPLAAQLGVSRGFEIPRQPTQLNVGPLMQGPFDPAGEDKRSQFGAITHPAGPLNARPNTPVPPPQPPPRPPTPPAAGSYASPAMQPASTGCSQLPNPPGQAVGSEPLPGWSRHLAMPTAYSRPAGMANWVRPPQPLMPRPISKAAGGDAMIRTLTLEGFGAAQSAAPPPGPSSGPPPPLGQHPFTVKRDSVSDIYGPLEIARAESNRSAQGDALQAGFLGTEPHIPGLAGLQGVNWPSRATPSPTPAMPEDLDPMDDDTADLFGLAPARVASKEQHSKDIDQQQRQQNKSQLGFDRPSEAELLHRQETLSDDFWTTEQTVTFSGQKANANSKQFMHATSPSMQAVQQQQHPSFAAAPVHGPKPEIAHLSGQSSASSDSFTKPESSVRPLQQVPAMTQIRPGPRPPPGDPPSHLHTSQPQPQAASGSTQQLTGESARIPIPKPPAPRPPPGDPPTGGYPTQHRPAVPSPRPPPHPPPGEPPAKGLSAGPKLGVPQHSLMQHEQHLQAAGGAQNAARNIPVPRPPPPRPSLGDPPSDPPSQVGPAAQHEQDLQTGGAKIGARQVPVPRPPPPRPPPGNPPSAPARPVALSSSRPPTLPAPALSQQGGGLQNSYPTGYGPFPAGHPTPPPQHMPRPPPGEPPQSSAQLSAAQKGPRPNNPVPRPSPPPPTSGQQQQQQQQQLMPGGYPLGPVLGSRWQQMAHAGSFGISAAGQTLQQGAGVPPAVLTAQTPRPPVASGLPTALQVCLWR